MFVRSRLRKWGYSLLLVTGLLLAGRAQAQAGIRVTSIAPPEYVFGQAITFQLSAESSAPIIDATLYLRTPDEPRTFVGKARFARGNAVEAVYVLEPGRRSIAAFAPVEYWWEIKDDQGHSLITDKLTFTHADNRYPWQSLADDLVRAHWVEGDGAFGQRALDIAADAVTRINRDLQLTALPEHIDLYIYPDPGAAREALRLTHQTWAEGHANPQFGIIIATIAPDSLDDTIQMEREIPHELAHILIYQAVGVNYAWVPGWLNEGLATFYQVRPDPEAPGLLAQARDRNALLSFESLCGGFPADVAEAQLAYVQSESFVRYIRDSRGASGLNKLLSAYADGSACAAGVQSALGLTLAELENEWLEQSVNANPATLQLRLWAPWLLISALVLAAPMVFGIFALWPKPESRVV
jgi:hypothetical protein